MSKVMRLKGAILAESKGSYYLVGNPKEPLDFHEWGFEPPLNFQAPGIPFTRLERSVDASGPFQPESDEVLLMDLEGEALAKKLVQLFMIRRNGSISERLWSLVTESGQDASAQEPAMARADWLAQTPEDIWDIVRDSVLRC